MPSLVVTKLTPELYEVFLSYKRATTKVERWLAVTSNRACAKIGLTIFEIQQAAQYIKSKRIEVSDLINYTFDRAITPRSEVTSHFRGFFATSTTEARNASHENFTKTLKAIFKSLCPNEPSSSLAKATSSSSTRLSNFFETLSSLPSESETPSASVDEVTEADEADNNGIKDDIFVEDLELHFALWDIETTCAKFKTYWAQAALGNMPVMLAGFLTNAAVASVASRFRSSRRFFEITEMITYDKAFEWFKSSLSGVLGNPDSSDSVVPNSFLQEMQAPFLAITLSRQKRRGYAHGGPPTMIGKPQDYITPLEEPCDSTGRLVAELEIFDFLLMSIKQLPHPDHMVWGWALILSYSRRTCTNTSDQYQLAQHLCLG